MKRFKIIFQSIIVITLISTLILGVAYAAEVEDPYRVNIIVISTDHK